MFQKFFIYSIFLFCFPLVCHSEPLNYDLSPMNGEASFEVNSTLHAVHGKTQNLTSTIFFDVETAQVGLPFQIQIPVESIQTANQARDRAMWKMIDSKNFPKIIWKIETMNCQLLAEGKETVCQATGALMIHGQAIQKKADIYVGKAGNDLATRGEIFLTTDEFKLKPPSVLGMIKVNKNIHISFKALWKQR